MHFFSSKKSHVLFFQHRKVGLINLPKPPRLAEKAPPDQDVSRPRSLNPPRSLSPPSRSRNPPRGPSLSPPKPYPRRGSRDWEEGSTGVVRRQLDVSVRSGTRSVRSLATIVHQKKIGLIRLLHS